MEPMCEKQHIHIQHAEATQMMRDFMVDPDHHMAHPKRYSNSITNSLGTYYPDRVPLQDSFIHLVMIDDPERTVVIKEI